MTAKEIVFKFYESNAILSKSYMEEILHDDLILEWVSSKGKLTVDKEDLLAISKDIRHSYYSLRCQIHHIMEEKGKVAINYTHYVTTFENPEEEMVLATFFVFWELKGGKLYKGYQISQLIND